MDLSLPFPTHPPPSVSLSTPLSELLTSLARAARTRPFSRLSGLVICRERDRAVFTVWRCAGEKSPVHSKRPGWSRFLLLSKVCLAQDRLAKWDVFCPMRNREGRGPVCVWCAAQRHLTQVSSPFRVQKPLSLGLLGGLFRQSEM